MKTRPTKLETGIESWLQDHEGWERDGTKAIARTYEFRDFQRAVAFVVKLASAAETYEHHPDIDIRSNRVRVRWSTKDANGLTRLDLILAEETDQHVG